MALLIAILAAAAAAAAVVTVSVLVGRRGPKVERRLAGYERHEVVPIEGEAGPQTAVVTQAMELTNRLADRAGLSARVAAALDRAELPVRPAELIFYVAVAAVMVFMLVSILLGSLVGVLVGAAVVAAPIFYVNRRQQARMKAFERQLPDTLSLLAGSMRAGFSFMQGLEAVAQEIAPPMRRELQRVFTEVRLGRPVEDALGEAAERMKSRDLAWAVMAVQIQREVGGNLAVLLDTVADTMKKREAMRREVRSLTAEGRLSAVVLAAVPFGLAILVSVFSPGYLNPLFTTAIGMVSVISGAGALVIGIFWLRKLVSIEV